MPPITRAPNSVSARNDVKFPEAIRTLKATIARYSTDNAVNPQYAGNVIKAFAAEFGSAFTSPSGESPCTRTELRQRMSAVVSNFADQPAEFRIASTAVAAAMKASLGKNEQQQQR